MSIADILDNPKFKVPGGFTIRRYVVTTDDDGVAVKTYADIHAEGVIVPYGDEKVFRAPDAEWQGDGIQVYTKTLIQTGDNVTGRIADDIIFNGLAYQVKDQDDYMIWGFNTATAMLQDPGGRAEDA
jgi:hypothetical protein